MKKWLAFWCTEGFEYLDEITRYEKWDQEQLIDILSNRQPKPNPLGQLITLLRLRAQANLQRQYELYAFSSEPDIELDSLRSWSESSPQSLVDWIRKHGVKVYSDKNLDKPRVIT